jgi:hypothetical protein
MTKYQMLDSSGKVVGEVTATSPEDAKKEFNNAFFKHSMENMKDFEKWIHTMNLQNIFYNKRLSPLMVLGSLR